MAGRGWDGWSWGCGKDMCGVCLSYHTSIRESLTKNSGFALFFSIFEFSRKVSADAAYLAVSELERLRSSPSDDKTRKSTARIVHGVTLVGGGVVAGLAYEVVCRPFDNARRWVHLDDLRKRWINQLRKVERPNLGLMWWLVSSLRNSKKDHCPFLPTRNNSYTVLNHLSLYLRRVDGCTPA